MTTYACTPWSEIFHKCPTAEGIAVMQFGYTVPTTFDVCLIRAVRLYRNLETVRPDPKKPTEKRSLQIVLQRLGELPADAFVSLPSATELGIQTIEKP